MGYYSTIEELPKINKVKEFIEAEKEMNERVDELAWWSFWENNFSINEQGYLRVEEYNSKFYESDDFAKWLLQFEPVGRLSFRDEEGEIWGYVFEHNKVYFLESELKIWKGKELV
jgi:hypothetical protein